MAAGLRHQDLAGTPNVLDLEELNLGQTQEVVSLNWNGGDTPNNNVGPGKGVRILDITGSSKKSTQVTFALSAYLKGNTVITEEVGGVSFSYPAGPIVARVEFGNGAAESFVEFNVPVGFSPNQTADNPETQSGVIVTVPGSAFRVKVRNDAALIPVNAFGDEVCDDQVGRGSSSSVMVAAHAAYQSRPGHGNVGGVHRIMPLVINDQLTGFPGSLFRVPPFARSLRFVRSNPTLAVEVTFMAADTGIFTETYTVPAGGISPEIPVPTNASLFLVTTSLATASLFADFTVQA